MSRLGSASRGQKFGARRIHFVPRKKTRSGESIFQGFRPCSRAPCVARQAIFLEGAALRLALWWSAMVGWRHGRRPLGRCVFCRKTGSVRRKRFVSARARMHTSLSRLPAVLLLAPRAQDHHAIDTKRRWMDRRNKPELRWAGVRHGPPLPPLATLVVATDDCGLWAGVVLTDRKIAQRSLCLLVSLNHLVFCVRGAALHR